MRSSRKDLDVGRVFGKRGNDLIGNRALATDVTERPNHVWRKMCGGREVTALRLDLDRPERAINFNGIAEKEKTSRFALDDNRVRRWM